MRHVLTASALALSISACAGEVSRAPTDAPLFDERAPTHVDSAEDVKLRDLSDATVLDFVAQRFALADVGIDSLRVTARATDSLSLTHVRVEQQMDGIPVEGGDAYVHLRGDTVYAVGGSLVAGVRVSSAPLLTATDAKAILADALATANPFGFTDAVVNMDVLSAPALRVVPGHDGAHLVWRSSTLVEDSEAPAQVVAAIDAQTGDVLELQNHLETARPGGGGGGTTTRTAAIGSGSTLYSGTVSLDTAALSTGGFELRDMNNTPDGSSYTIDMSGRQNGGSVDTDSDNAWALDAANDAQFGATRTFQYYKTTYNRAGIANDGKGALSRAHYGRNYANAFWSDSCFCMTYGDGDGTTFTALTSLDVAGHEMTHGVTSRTANLAYSGQSGGLNESMSDIFGTAVEFFANTASDPGDYLIGEKIRVGGGFLRSMSNPTADGRSIDTASAYTSTMDVHYSSGLQNNVYFLLSEGGTHRLGGVVTGIGRANAEAVFYRALTTYMTSSTNFAGARAATVQAATDLFGAGSAQVASVQQAWSACGVN